MLPLNEELNQFRGWRYLNRQTHKNLTTTYIRRHKSNNKNKKNIMKLKKKEQKCTKAA